MATCFFFLHEEAHHVLGHLNYFKAEYNAAELEDDPGRIDLGKEFVARQIMEREADQYAAIQMLGTLWTQMFYENYSILRQLRPETRAKLCWISFALAAALIAITNPRSISDIDTWGEHPQAYFRAREIANPMSIIDRINLGRVGWPADILLPAWLDVRNELAMLSDWAPGQFGLFADLPGTGQSFEHDAIIARYNATIDDWHEVIRAELEGHRWRASSFP